MGYYVRLLSPSEKTISFGEINKEVETTRLTAGNGNQREDVSISGSSEMPISILSLIAGGSDPGNSVINKLKEGLSGAYPASARRWIRSATIDMYS